ncbi:MAG: hypothetical protein MK105_05705 [Crocinitomicaceae bacterium]|nr:hypothetical protein [Crocinitomicaceae bacterium]
MYKVGLSLIIATLTMVILTGCQGDEASEENLENTVFKEYVASDFELECEKYAVDIDIDTTLRRGNSLYYSREDGATMEVFISVNAADETTKIIENYSNAGSVSLCSNTFYFKDGKKYISKELFEEGTELTGHFVERISYYDENEKPVLTKIRKAEYEDQLDFEMFEKIDNYDCSTERALQVLNQEGEFATTFQGFISEEPYLYLIVGEDEPTGYTSSLVVQYVDQTIQKLQMNEKEMIGKGIQVGFETLSGTQGYEYQILLSTVLR